MDKRRGLRVLMVADMSEPAAVLAVHVRADGHDVVLAADSRSALAAAQTALPDVVFLDLDLPGLDADALTKQIQSFSSWRRPLLIVLSEGEQEPRRAQPAGIDLHLVKPVDLDMLQRLLQRFQAIVQDIEGFDPVI